MKSYTDIQSEMLRKKSFLCVGLDPDPDKMPPEYKESKTPLFDFCHDIVRWTYSYAVAFKINVAFFESHGPAGWQQLEKLIGIIPDENLVILDAKRADIGNTSDQYAKYFFDTLQADAVTLHPYMGKDSLEPFFRYPGKWAVILALTSNPGSTDLELQTMLTGELLYQRVLRLYGSQGTEQYVMFVCGATHPALFQDIRNICPNHFLLVPGVGAQGGDLHETIKAGKNAAGGLLINVSRGICYPKITTQFKSDVIAQAVYYQQEMASYF